MQFKKECIVTKIKMPRLYEQISLIGKVIREFHTNFPQTESVAAFPNNQSERGIKGNRFWRCAFRRQWSWNEKIPNGMSFLALSMASVWRTRLSRHRWGREKARTPWSAFRVMGRLGTPEANVLTQAVVKGETGFPTAKIWVESIGEAELRGMMETSSPNDTMVVAYSPMGQGTRKSILGTCQRGKHTYPVSAAALEPFLYISISLSWVRDAQPQYVFPNYLTCAKLCSCFYVPLTTF